MPKLKYFADIRYVFLPRGEISGNFTDKWQMNVKFYCKQQVLRNKNIHYCFRMTPNNERSCTASKQQFGMQNQSAFFISTWHFTKRLSFFMTRKLSLFKQMLYEHRNNISVYGRLFTNVI